MQEKRINIEFLRVVAIIMTITIHLSNIYVYNFGKISDTYFFTAVIYNSLSRICVPIFFMISGAFAIDKEYTSKKYIHRILKFIFILIAWSIIYYLHINEFRFENIHIVIVNSIFNSKMTSQHLWYMYAIIGIYIALPFIQNMCKNMTYEHENLFLILWIILSGIHVVIVPIAQEIIGSNIDFKYNTPIINATYYLGYFICGHILFKRFDNATFNKYKNIICSLLFIVSAAVTAFCTFYFSLKSKVLFEAAMWYRGILIIFATFSVFLIVVANKNKFKKTYILKISKYTFGIYLVHMIFINILKDHIDILKYNPLFLIPALTILVYILSLLSCIVISKIPFLNKIIS